MEVFRRTQAAAHRGDGRLTLSTLRVSQISTQSPPDECVAVDVHTALVHAAVHWPWIVTTQSALQAGRSRLREAGLQILCPESWKVRCQYASEMLHGTCGNAEGRSALCAVNSAWDHPLLSNCTLVS
jgi:hypothetical protein